MSGHGHDGHLVGARRVDRQLLRMAVVDLLAHGGQDIDPRVKPTQPHGRARARPAGAAASSRRLGNATSSTPPQRAGHVLRRDRTRDDPAPPRRPTGSAVSPRIDGQLLGRGRRSSSGRRARGARPSATAPSRRTVPPCTKNVRPVIVAARRGEVRDERRHVGRVPHVEALGRGGHDLAQAGRGLGEPGAGGGRDAVRPHAVARQLLRADDAEGPDARLGGAVVGLAGVAEQPRGRRRVDDRGVARSRPPSPARASGRPRSGSARSGPSGARRRRRPTPPRTSTRACGRAGCRRC